MEIAPNDFVDWLRERAAASGFDPDSRGGIAALARAAGVDASPVSRALGGKMVPKIDTQRALARALGVEPREMYVRSGTIAAEDLLDGLPQEPESVNEVDLEAVAARLGVPPERQDVFIQAALAMAEGLRQESSE